jgi:hypothetical protein
LRFLLGRSLNEADSWIDKLDLSDQ